MTICTWHHQPAARIDFATGHARREERLSRVKALACPWIAAEWARPETQNGSLSRPSKGAARHPYDGHTLARVIPAIEQLVGNKIDRAHADAGYRGHNAPPDYKFKIYTSKQKRGVTPQIQREMRRRAAVEPVIGHIRKSIAGSELSRPPSRRCQQRHPRRRRLQLQPPDPVAEIFIAPHPGAGRHSTKIGRGVKGDSSQSTIEGTLGSSRLSESSVDS